MNLFWTEERIVKLRQMRSIGLNYEEIAAALGTSVASAKSAYTRYVNGRKPDAEAEQQRTARRREQIAEWTKANRDAINERNRRRRAERASRT